MNAQETKTVTVTNKDFRYAVKYLKKNGYEFDATSKTWSGTKSIEFLIEEGYATEAAMKFKNVSDMCVGDRGWYEGNYVELRAGGLSGGCETDLFLALADEGERDESVAEPEIVIDTDDVTP